MKTKGILALAILGLLLVSTFAISAIATPVVQAADQDLFKMTMIAPGNANLLRRQWGLIIANSFKAVGINTNVVFLGWGGVYDRALTPPPELIGKTWDEGGYDALFVGYTPGSPSTPFLGTFQIYFSDNIPPNSNYYLWNNSESDQLILDMLRLGYTPAGVAKFQEWQELQYDEIPVSQIFFETSMLPTTKNISYNGFHWLFDNTGPVPQFLTNAGDQFIFAATGEPLDFNPPLSNSWYDTIAFNPIFDGLFFLDADYVYKPAVAESFSVSPDGYTYTYNLRDDVTWQDGWSVTADDVLFTWLAYMNPQGASQQSATTAGYIGDDITFKWLNGTETRLVLDLAGGIGYYPALPNETGPDNRLATIEAVDATTVVVTIANLKGQTFPAATFHPEGEPGALLPMHILGQIPFADWKEHPFNVPGSDPVVIGNTTVAGPIGCGPYKYVSYNPATALVTTEKYNGYWNKTGLESIGMFGVETYYVKYIVEKDAAIAALKNGEVNALDQNYAMERDYVAGLLDFADVYVLEASGIQQLGYNLRHPIWGTGVATPNGIVDPANAATYAKYVRQAFDYLIPRELIVDNLMSGLGTPLGIHVNPLSPYLHPTLRYREYDFAAAKALLAQAGYQVGVTPPGPVIPVKQYLVNEPIVFTGQFLFDPVPSINEGGIVVRLWMAQVNTTGNFTPVAQTISTSGGYYQLSYTPTVNGTLYFKVELTGVGANMARLAAATDPTFPYEGLTKAIDSQETPVVGIPVTTFADITGPLQTQINAQNAQINALNAQIGTLNTLAYAGIILAIVALLVAIVAFMKKK